MKKNIVFICVIVIFAISLFLVNLFSKQYPVIPFSKPNEQNRVFFRDKDRCYSIVSPDEWDITSGAYIQMFSRPERFSSSLSFSSITIAGGYDTPVFEEEDIVKKLPSIQFQEETAYYRIYTIQARKLWGPKGYTFEIFFTRKGKWYTCRFFTNVKQKEMPPTIIWDYFNTFMICP
jgi:hypothetical protein